MTNANKKWPAEPLAAPAAYWACGAYLISFLIFFGLFPRNPYTRAVWSRDFLFLTAALLAVLAGIFYNEPEKSERQQWLRLFFAVEWLLGLLFACGARLHEWKPGIFG